MFLLATAALFAACGDKDNANDPSDSPSGGGDNPGSSTYAFSGRKLAKAVVHFEHQYGNTWTYDFSWNGDLLQEIRGFDSGRKTWRAEVVYENGRPVTINGYRKDALDSRITYTYSGNKVSHVLYMEMDENDEGVMVLDTAVILDYTYTGNKITLINATEWRRNRQYHLSWDGNNISTFTGCEIEYSDKKSPFYPPVGLFGYELLIMLSDNPSGWGYSTGNWSYFSWSENLMSRNINKADYNATTTITGTFDGEYPLTLTNTTTADDMEGSKSFSVTYTYAD